MIGFENIRSSFLKDPESAALNLFSGRYSIGQLSTLDSPEILFLLVSDGEDLGSELLDAVDTGVGSFVLTARENFSDWVSRLSYSVYSKRLCDAFVAARMLKLEKSRREFRTGCASWSRFLAPLRISPERDPQLEFWRMLADIQEDSALIPQWMNLAADPRPEYLTVALAGIQNLSFGGSSAVNVGLSVRALLLHAIEESSSPGAAKKLFNLRLSAFRGIGGPFPKSPGAWAIALEEAFQDFENSDPNDSGKELLEMLRDGLKRDPRVGNERKYYRKLRPTSWSETDSLRDAVYTSDENSAVLFDRFVQMMTTNLDYAISTGNSRQLEFTLTKVGLPLMRTGKVSKDSENQFEYFIEKTLSWAPASAHIWMVWSDWLEHLGQFEKREWVLREMVQIFPEDGHSKVELARFLRCDRSERVDEAEGWLKLAIQNDPFDNHPRAELAHLLLADVQDRKYEAESLLRESITRIPDNSVYKYELARILVSDGNENLVEALSWLRQAAHDQPNDLHVRSELARLLLRMGESGFDEAAQWIGEILELNPEDEHGQLAYINLMLKRGEDYLVDLVDWIREALTRNPSSSVLRLGLARALLRDRSNWPEMALVVKSVLDDEPENELAASIQAHISDAKNEVANEGFENGIQDAVGSDTVNGAGGQEVNEKNKETEHRDLVRGAELSGLDLTPETGIAFELKSVLETLAERNRKISRSDDETIEKEIAEEGLEKPGLIHAQTGTEFPFFELERRSRISREFFGRFFCGDSGEFGPDSEILAESAAGDPIASLYKMWLEPEKSVNVLPHSWALSASKIWLENPGKEQWVILDESYPEAKVSANALLFLKKPETYSEDEKDQYTRPSGFETTGSKSKYVDFFSKRIRDGVLVAAEEVRNGVAFATFASAVEPPPMFV